VYCGDGAIVFIINRNYLAAACGGIFHHEDTKTRRHKDTTF
jgi:hypothetical protein